MTIESRWTTEVPKCSLQKWVFGSSNDPVPDRKAFLDPERPDTHFLTLADYRLVAKRLALGLQREGLKPGGRVLLFSGNNLFFPSLFMGVLMAGGIFTGANPTYVARELTYQLRDSGATFMVVEESVLEIGLEAAEAAGLSRDKVFIFDADVSRAEATQANQPKPGKAGRTRGVRHWTELLAGDTNKAEAWNWAEPSDPANVTCCLNYSSGTTGVPKGVEISHYSYVANGTGVVFVNDLNPDRQAILARSRGLCFLPMYHAYAQTYFIANLPRIGTPVYVMPRFDFVKLLTYVQRYRITLLTCVPPIVVALAKHPIVAKFDLSSVETIGCGAAPLGQEIGDDVEKLFPAGEVMVRQGWGMTEVTCTSQGQARRPRDWEGHHRARDAGRAVGYRADADARILGEAGGDEGHDQRRCGRHAVVEDGRYRLCGARLRAGVHLPYR
jgi:acyl-CoA synthetase (AMP-forming)/AMP-acid ligase II